MDAPPSLGGLLSRGALAAAICAIAAVAGILIQLNCDTPYCVNCSSYSSSDDSPCSSYCNCSYSSSWDQSPCSSYCNCSSSSSSDHDSLPCRCKLIPLFMKVPLIAVHLIPFMLMPLSMWVCQQYGSTLVEMGAKSPVQMVRGLSYIMVSISGEVGWHVHQRWFYHEDYDILNFFFYAFITLGTTFWALGAQKNDTQSGIHDGLLMLCTPMTAVVYGLGAYLTSHGLPQLATKVPIYLIMSYQYGVLSWRLFRLLKDDAKVWLFPFFSVGVNMFFIMLLNFYQANPILNPLFHMLHDAAGTELGILIITILLWDATSKKLQDRKTS